MRMYLLDKKQRVRRWLKDNDFIEAEMTEEINAANQINFSMPLKDRIADNIYYVAIPAPRSKQKYLLFKLLSERVQNDRIEYQGIEEAYDELKQYGYIKDIRPNDRTAEEMLKMVLEPTRWTLGNVPETSHQSTNFYYITYLEALQKIVGLFNIELTFEVTIDPKSNKITRRQVNVYTEQGQRTGKRFEYGSNLLTVQQEQDSQELITALVGRGKGELVSEGHDDTPDGYGRRITFADVVWTKKDGHPVDKPAGQEYLVDPEATALYGFSDGNPRIGLTVFEDIEDPVELINATWRALQSLKRPKVSFKADVTDVGQLGLGDTVAIIRHDLKIEYFTRVYKVKHNLLNENDNQIELGDDFSSHNITSSLIKVDEIANEARETAGHAAIAANGKNNNYYSSVQPLASVEGDIWYKDLGNGETDMYQYHNGGWVFIQSTRDLHVVENQVKEAQQGLNQAKADIISNKQKADADIENLNKSIEDNKKVADESLQKLNDSVTNLQGQYDNNVVPNLNKVMADASDALQKYISAQNSIADLTKQAQEQGKDIADVTNTVKGLNINYANLAGDVSSTKVDVKGLQTTIGTANGDIAQLKLDAQNLQTMLAGKVDNTTYTNFVNLTNQALNARLTASDLNGYAKTVDVQATANGLRVDLNAVTGKLNNMIVGNRNLIRNSAFPTNTDYWESTAEITTHIFYYQGKKNLFVINNSSTDEKVCDSARFPVKRNTDYVFSFKGFMSWNVSSYDVWFLARKNGETSQFSYSKPIVSGQRLSNGSLQYVKDIVFNSGDNDEAYIRFDNNGSNDGKNSVLCFGEIQLEEGNKSTAWNAAPEDEKQRVDDIASQLSARITANSQQFSSYYTKVEADNKTNSAKEEAKSNAVNAIKSEGNWQGLNNILTNSGFLQTADGFLQKVQQTTQPMIDANNGGGINLVGLSGFHNISVDQLRSRWAVSDNVSINAKGGRNQTGSIVIDARATDTYREITQTIDLEPDTDYRLSFHLLFVELNNKDYSAYTCLVEKDSSGNNVVPYRDSNRLIANTDDRNKNSFIIHTSTSTSKGILYIRANPGTKIELEEVKLEKGRVSTPWSPAPADFATQIKFTELSQSLDGLRSTVGSNYGDLLTQISQSSSAVRTELTNKITGVQNQITTTANGLDAKIAGIRVGGRNLIQNSNASIDRAVPWENTTLQAHSFYYNGTKKMFVLQTNSKNELTSGSNWFKIKPGQKYTFSFWGFQSWNMSNYDVWLLLRHSGENGSYDSTYQIVTGERLSNGNCQKVTRTFTAPDGYDEAYIRLDNNGSNDGNNAVFFFNELKLEEGTIATDWSPAPEDDDKAFAALNVTIDGLKSTISGNYGDLKNQITQTNQTTRNEIDDKVKGLQGQLTLQANNFNVSLNNLQIGGTNLIRNSGNFQNTNYWTLDSWGGQRGQLGLGKHGFWKNNQENLLEITNYDVNATAVAKSSRFNVKPSTTYTLSFNGFHDVNLKSYTVYFLGRKYNSSNDYDVVVPIIAGSKLSASQSTYVKVQFNTGNSDEGYIRFDSNGILNSGMSTLYLADIKVEEGDKATAWSPAPEDQVAKNQILAQINMSAGTTLIQNNKIYMDASSTIFSGNAFIPSAAITSLNADKITAGTLNAANVNIINLNANNITTGAINGQNLKIDLNTGNVEFQHGRIHNFSNTVDINLDQNYISTANYNTRALLKDGELQLTQPNLYDTNGNWYFRLYNGGGAGDAWAGASLIGRDSVIVANEANAQGATGFTSNPMGTATFSGLFTGKGTNSWMPTILGGAERGVFIKGGNQMSIKQNIMDPNDGGVFATGSPFISVGVDGPNNNWWGNRIVIDGEYLHVPTAWRHTTGGAPNLVVASDGALVRSTSASKYKTEIHRDYSTDYGDRLLELPTATWIDKGQKKRYQAGKRSIKPNKYFGMIAEDLADAGLDLFVSRNPQTHEIEGIQYERIAPALIPVIRKLKKKVQQLEEKLNEQ
jgi:phage minor structural protein|nr:MAG TPA: Minor structural protein 4 [Caudoviricetes sp.]